MIGRDMKLLGMGVSLVAGLMIFAPTVHGQAITPPQGPTAAITGGTVSGATISVAAGTNAAPSLTLGGDTIAGWWRNAANQWTYVFNTTNEFSLLGSVVRAQSGLVLNWTAADSTTSADTGISRDSAGTVAIGNGAAGDFSGTVKATHFTSGSTAGVSCSGSPTASFASVNGIVTHC